MNEKYVDMLDTIILLAKQAGEEIMTEYQRDHQGSPKADGSPLTVADLKADELITKGLQKNYPSIPIVSEEQSNKRSPESLQNQEFFLVDPLDGTKEFIKKNGEFTVNIALIKNATPILGVVHAPALNETWYGVVGVNAKKENANQETSVLHAKSPNNPNGLVITGSRSHGQTQDMDNWIGERKIAEVILCGSSIKLCRIAEGVVDAYPRLAPTMEWDTAAAHAVLAASGGNIQTLEGEELTYCKDSFRNPFFIATGRDWKE